MPLSEIYQVRFFPTPPALDGRGRDGGWSLAPELGPFVRHDGTPARLATTARLGYDEGHLYLAFACVDDDIWGSHTERESPIYDEEVVEAFLDPAGEGTRYFEFEVSPRNVTLDGVNTWTDGRHAWDDTWDCAGLHTAVVVDGVLGGAARDTAWSATLAIPFRSLGRETPQPGERWRANLYRIDRPHGGQDEYQAWRPTQPGGGAPNYNVPQRFGVLEFAGG